MTSEEHVKILADEIEALTKTCLALHREVQSLRYQLSLCVRPLREGDEVFKWSDEKKALEPLDKGDSNSA